MVTRTEKAKARIGEALRTYPAILQEAKRRNTNESDTSGIVHDMLGDVLGYDKHFEVTGEYKVRGQYVDYALKLKDQVKFLVEVKAVGIALNPNHLRQITTYAVNEGVEWVILTNASIWQVYHIGFEKPINVDLVFEADALSEDRASVIDLLYLVSREGAARDEIRAYWSDKLALSGPNLARAVLSDEVIDQIRREFKHLTGYRLSPEEIKRLLLLQVVRPDVAEAIGGSKPPSKPTTGRGRPPETSVPQS
jgi:predicted type IV restriction endonuclease